MKQIMEKLTNTTADYQPMPFGHGMIPWTQRN